MAFRVSCGLSAVSAAMLLLASAPASAATLIGFEDGSLGSSASAFLSDTSRNAAVQWTQTVSSTNVTVEALLRSNVGSLPANWWITNAIGVGASSANVVASGIYVAPSALPGGLFDASPKTTLATGLNFAAGTYYLVLDGPAGRFQNNADWVGDISGVITTLAPGFSIGGYSSASTPSAFGPASNFEALSASNATLVFGLSTQSVPEPASWALMVGGFGLLGAAMRRRRADLLLQA